MILRASEFREGLNITKHPLGTPQAEGNIVYAHNEGVWRNEVVAPSTLQFSLISE